MVADSGLKCPPGYELIANIDSGAFSNLNEGVGANGQAPELFLCQSFTKRGVMPEEKSEEEKLKERAPPAPGTPAAIIAGVKGLTAVEQEKIRKRLREKPPADATAENVVDQLLDEFTLEAKPREQLAKALRSMLADPQPEWKDELKALMLGSGDEKSGGVLGSLKDGAKSLKKKLVGMERRGERDRTPLHRPVLEETRRLQEVVDSLDSV